MNRLKILCTIMAVAISCHAQSTNGNRLVEEGKTWNMKYHNYEAFDLYPDYDYKYFIKGDTLVGGKNCKKLYSYNEQNSDAVAYKMSMHETDGKVFFIPVNSTESFLLYDFNASAGDIITIDCTSYPGYKTYSMNVRETRRLKINGVERRCIKMDWVVLSEDGAISDTYGSGWWVEGVGSILGLLNAYGFGAEGSNNKFVSCELDGNVILDKAEFDSFLVGHASLLVDGRKWTYLNNRDSKLDASLFIDGDTLLGGRACRMVKVAYNADSASGKTGTWYYLYEEEGKVYNYNPETERFSLYYDFTANVGDTVRWGELPEQSLLVTDVDHVIIKGQSLRRLTYRNLEESGSQGGYVGQWVESVGSERGIVSLPLHDPLYAYQFQECLQDGGTLCEACLFFGDSVYARRMVADHPCWRYSMANGARRETVCWERKWMSYLTASPDQDKYVFDVFEAKAGDDAEPMELMLHESGGRVYAPLWMSDYIKEHFPEITSPYVYNCGYGLQPLHLLYDFTLGLGEKYPCLGDVIVERMDSITTRDGMDRRVQHLSNGLVIVEGVGCVNSPLGPFAYQCWTDTLSASGKYGRGWLESYVKDGEVVFDKDDLRALGLYDGGTVAVKEAATPPPTPNANNTYDLQGRRLQAPPVQGVYIRNGKKMVIK